MISAAANVCAWGNERRRRATGINAALAKDLAADVNLVPSRATEQQKQKRVHCLQIAFLLARSIAFRSFIEIDERSAP